MSIDVECTLVLLMYLLSGHIHCDWLWSEMYDYEMHEACHVCVTSAKRKGFPFRVSRYVDTHARLFRLDYTSD